MEIKDDRYPDPYALSFRDQAAYITAAAQAFLNTARLLQGRLEGRVTLHLVSGESCHECEPTSKLEDVEQELEG